MTRRVLITAGASGIGNAMAKAFAEDGYHVWITDIDEAALMACSDKWEKTRVDVTDQIGMEHLFQTIADKWSGLDVVCANAGTAGPTSTLEDFDLDEFRHCVAINLEGAFLVTKLATPVLKRQGAGCILYTSSMSGLNGFPNRVAYASAKWAINGLMKTAAMELGPFGIRANSLCPGSVEGLRMQNVIRREAAAKNTTPDAIRKGYESGVSMRTFVEAEDVANMATFLASDKARFISGQIIGIDGHTENPDPKV